MNEKIRQKINAARGAKPNAPSGPQPIILLQLAQAIADRIMAVFIFSRLSPGVQSPFGPAASP